jgi:hypothetical protein
MKYLNTILKLKKYKELSYSKIPKPLLDELSNEDLITIISLSPSKKKVKIKETFLKKYHNIELIDEADSRSELITAQSHSKSKRFNPQEGLYLNGSCQLDCIQLPIAKESAFFTKNFPKVHKDTHIIGVENFDNLIYFEHLQNLIGKKDILVVYRNKMMHSFFNKLSNQITYFGDFDLAGVHIFIHEVLAKNNNISLFIPPNIEVLLKNHGNTILYAQQLQQYKNLKSDNSKIQQLLNYINYYQKGLEQEFFITFNKKKNNE